jgi:outer membrane receptor protein involved in Fe transport
MGFDEKVRDNIPHPQGHRQGRYLFFEEHPCCRFRLLLSPSRSNDLGAFTDSDTNINKTEYGFYINDEIYLLKNLQFSAGYRLAKVKYDFDYTDNTGFLAPIDDFVKKDKDAFRLGLNFIIPERGNIFVNYAQGFRFPATDEYFSPFAAHPPSTKPSNPTR